MSVTFCYKIEVRFRDCDEFGHVNNAVYFTYLEETRHAYLRQLASQGVSSNAVDEKLPHGFVLVRTECDFLSEALPGDWLEIQLRVSKIGRSSFGYEYEIRNTSKSQLVARAKSVHVAYDRIKKRSQPIPEEFRAVLERAMQGLSETSIDVVSD